MPTLERIGTKICPILVKLAEIYFLQADFEASEKTVDAILTRQSADQPTLIFAYLLKFYFCKLSTKAELAESFFQKAQQLHPGIKVSDLDLFTKVKARQGGASVIIRNQNYVAMSGTDDRCVVQLQAQSVQTFPAFLVSLVESITAQTNLETFTKNQFVYDCTAWIRKLEESRNTFILNWHQQQQKQTEDAAPVVKTQPKQEKNKNLRKKPDTTEQQIKTIKLHRFTAYREFMHKNQDFEAQSTFEITNIAELMANSKTTEQMQVCRQEIIVEVLDVSLIDDLLETLAAKLNRTNCQFFVRNLLTFICTRKLVTTSNAKQVFKIFQMKLDESSLAITHPEVLQTMFELVLFNQEVIKETKSGPIMRLRTLLYDFCQQSSQLDKIQCAQLRFRMIYALMFTAFEVKHDMEQAVVYFEQLDMTVLQQEQHLYLKWVGSAFEINTETVSNFGNLKIKEAQRINKQNQALRALKQIESETTKTAYQRQSCSKPQALFYLEQFLLHLKMLVQVNETTNVNFQLNDEKIKEIWDQLMFCLVRVQPIAHFFTITNNVFCMLSAFKSLTHKSLVYETVLLKKIDLEPLLQEISDRTRIILNESGVSKAEYKNYEPLTRQYLESHHITQLTLNQTQTHIARLVTPEFIFWNAIEGGSMGNSQDPGQPFAVQLLRCLFLLEHVQSNIAKDHMFGVALLMKQLDQMAQEQQELLMRAYSKLFVIAFPLMIRASINGASHPDFKLLIEKSFKYLFGFVCLDAQADFSEEMQIDMDEITELSLFAGMQTKADKPKFPVPLPSLLFQQMAVNKKEIDLQLLTDIVVYANELAQGRLLSAKLTQRDYTNCVKIADSISKLLLGYIKRDDEPLIRQKCFIANPFNQCEVKQSQSVHLIVKFLLNVFGSLAIQVYPQTIVMPLAKRLSIVEKLAALKDLRKLKQLVNLDLSTSHDLPASALLSSIVDLQYYMQHCNNKLLQDYKPDLEMKQFKETATNAAIWALKESFQQNNLQNCLNALHQLLSIFYARVMSKQNITKPKFQSLVATCYCLAVVCELVQCLLTPPKRDPRIQQMSIEGLHQQARVVIENLLVAIHSQYQAGQQRQCLIENIHEHISSLRALSQEMELALYRLLPKAQLNPDYPFIQVVLSRLGPSDVSQLELQVSKKAFDLAVCQNDTTIALESLLHLIERNLQFIINYKYTQANQNVIKGFLDQTKAFLLDADLFFGKFPNRDEELLYDTKASHLLRPKLVLPVIDQAVEGVIQRLYKQGDTAVALISEGSIAFKWYSLKFKTMLQSSLFSEAVYNKSDSLKLLAEASASQLYQELCTVEDSISQKVESFQQQPIFYLQHLNMSLNTIQERSCQSLIAMYQSSTKHKSITELRLQLKSQLLQLWEKAQDYESVNIMFRKQLEIFRKNSDKLTEVVTAFNLTKDTLIGIIKQFFEPLLQEYLSLRGQVLEYQDKKKQAGFSQCTQMLKEFRLKFELTPTNNVGFIRDIFELFLDSHYSKQFLRKQDLVSQQQKCDIRLALFSACALCGPDQETEPGAPRFLDLHKFGEDDNWLDALQVCIKWYTFFLEQRKTKKDLDLAKRLNNCVEELKQETFVDISATPKKPQINKHEVSAAKVFSQKKLI